MNHADDDYLWNRSGRDPEIERLEALLAPFRAPSATRPRCATRRPARPRLRAARSLAVAASIAILLFAPLALSWRLAWPEDGAWAVSGSEGEALLGGRALRAGDALPPRVELRTGDASGVEFRIARIGQARLGPRSRLRIERTGPGEHRVVLVEGTLKVRVWAPPRRFGVRLAQTELVDLGCAFEVHAAPDGSGWLRVQSGWVAVETGAREVLVPARARVSLAVGGIPSTPYDEAASEAFVDALRVIDARRAAVDPNGEEVRRLIAAARAEDAISLLSLLTHHPALARGPIFDHLERQWPGTPAVDREAAVRGATAALEPWWRALPYPRVKRWWLHWRDALPADGNRFSSTGG